ncbi:MAG: methyltransferase domain-containing protein [Casimicrobium sp.]
MSAELASPAPQPWDDAAAGWNEHTHVIREWLREVTDAMLNAANIGPGSRVLDIAAGAGDQTVDIARRIGPNGFVLATDLSTPILALAQGNLRAAGFSNFDTQVADAQALNLGGKKFDAAVSRLGLMFCTEPHLALQQAHLALRANGRFSAVVFSHPEANPCLGIALRTALKHAHAGQPSIDPIHPNPFAPGTLMSLGKPGLMVNLLADAGFTDIEVRAVAAPFRLPSSRHYVDFVRAGGSPLRAILSPLSTEAQADAWDDMAQQLDQFATREGWAGPNELLLCAATATTDAIPI